MGDWIVALILLAISLVLVVSVGLVCRVMGVWRLTTLFGGSEERAVLTKSEQHNGYMINAEPEVNLAASTGFSKGGDSAYRNLESHMGPQHPIPQNLPEPIPDPDPDGDKADSPVSVDSVSITTEVEPSSASRLQRAISCDSVASDSSVLEWEPEMAPIGQLEFGLEYDGDSGQLVVSVIQARGLEPDQVTGTLDTYVKVWLNPHRDGKVQTKVQRNTTDPVYKERFLFPVAPEDLDATQAQFQVYSSDKYARHKLQGETELRLGDIDLRQPIRVWMNLRDMDEKPTELGDIMFSLSYLPTAERLTVVIVKARNLHWGKGRDTGDCFVKVYLLQNGRKVSKKKTSVKRDAKNPIFNEAMIFSVPTNALQNVQLRVTIAEQLSDGKYSSIGHVIVGSNLSGTEVTHWNQMMTSLRKPIAMWHRIIKK